MTFRHDMSKACLPRTFLAIVLLSDYTFAFTFVCDPSSLSRNLLSHRRCVSTASSKSFLFRHRHTGPICCLPLSQTTGSSENYEPVVVPRPSFAPLRIVHPFWTGPAHEEDVRLVSTHGWGDGYHPTTFLSLQFLAQHIKPGAGQTILDYGTGSGVLAMASIKLGCKSAVGVDVDYDALEAAQSNLEANGIDNEQVGLYHNREVIQDINGIILRDDTSGKALQFDIVVANILVGPLMRLAPVLSTAIKEDTGALCLCGLRPEHVKDVQAAYARFGVIFDSTIETMVHNKWREGAEGEGTWARVTATRRKMTAEERRDSIRWWNEQAVQ